MAQVERDPDVRAVHLLGDAHGVLDRLQPEGIMGIQGDPHPVLGGLVGQVLEDLHRPGVALRVRELVLLALGEDPEHRVSPGEDFHPFLQSGIVRLRAGVEVDAGIGGEHLEVVLVQLGQQFCERAGSGVVRANPGVAEILEQLDLRLDRLVLGVRDGVVEREEGIRPRGGDPNVAVADRPVIALEHQRPQRLLIMVGAGPGRSGQLDVAVDENAVVDDLLEAGVGDLAAGPVEARRPEHHVQRLPLARRP